MKIIDISNCSDEVIVYINKLQTQLQQKENIIKELNDTIKELQEDIDVLTSDDDNDSVWLEELNK